MLKKRISKKEMIKILKNNYQVVFDRKKELELKNIELQEKVMEQSAEIVSLKKKISSLKAQNTKLKNKSNIKLEGTSIEKGNKIIEKLRKE